VVVVVDDLWVAGAVVDVVACVVVAVVDVDGPVVAVVDGPGGDEGAGLQASGGQKKTSSADIPASPDDDPPVSQLTTTVHDPDRSWQAGAAGLGPQASGGVNGTSTWALTLWPGRTTVGSGPQGAWDGPSRAL
jgi:hypothetical protein